MQRICREYAAHMQRICKLIPRKNRLLQLMSKRSVSSRESLTGGTFDVSPQLLSVQIQQVAANTYAEGTIVVPINRFAVAPTEAVVMEILKTYWNLSELDANPAAGGDVRFIHAVLSTRASPALLPFNSPFVISAAEKVYRGAFTAAGSYAVTSNEPIIQDLSDGAGHGVLVATDQLLIGLNTQGYTAVASANMKILYRFKKIGLAEYIGIVQSQS